MKTDIQLATKARFFLRSCHIAACLLSAVAGAWFYQTVCREQQPALAGGCSDQIIATQQDFDTLFINDGWVCSLVVTVPADTVLVAPSTIRRIGRDLTVHLGQNSRLHGFENLEEVSGVLSVAGPGYLEEIALQRLERVGEVRIFAILNTSLSLGSESASVTEVRALFLELNPNLTEFTAAIASLQHLEISENIELISASSFGLMEFGTLILDDLPSLQELQVSRLPEAFGHVLIRNSPELLYDGFAEQVRSLDNGLVLDNPPASLQLQNLAAVAGLCRVSACLSPDSPPMLSSLRVVFGLLDVADCLDGTPPSIELSVYVHTVSTRPQGLAWPSATVAQLLAEMDQDGVVFASRHFKR